MDKLTKKQCIASAKKCKTKTEWKKKNPGHYRFAQRGGFYMEATKHMLKPWTDKTLKTEANKYKPISNFKLLTEVEKSNSVKKFKQEHPAEYMHAVRNGYLPELRAILSKPAVPKHSKKRTLSIAKKHINK